MHPRAQKRVPTPELTRQCAFNPELQRIANQAGADRRELHRAANDFARRGMADPDCQNKWDIALQDLLLAQDLLILSQSTREWYLSNRFKSLADLLLYPLRFPVRLLVTPNGTLCVHQRPVNAPHPDWTAFTPIQNP